jgi:hypothetical protein
VHPGEIVTVALLNPSVDAPVYLPNISLTFTGG